MHSSAWNTTNAVINFSIDVPASKVEIQFTDEAAFFETDLKFADVQQYESNRFTVFNSNEQTQLPSPFAQLRTVSRLPSESALRAMID